MYSWGVLVLGVHKSYSMHSDYPSCFDRSKEGRGLAAREGSQHVWVHAHLPCLQRMPTQKLWITPGCIQAERS